MHTIAQFLTQKRKWLRRICSIKGMKVFDELFGKY
jgi:hypothetical protein